MIFILNSSVMNGTVTMSIHSLGIEADSFEEAIIKVKNLENYNPMNEMQDLIKFSFYVQQELGNLLQCYCTMKNEPLEIVK